MKEEDGEKPPGGTPGGFAIETTGLTRVFGGFTAVDGLTLSIAKGSVFGLLGPNGAGKTTTIKMLTTLLPISSGKAVVAGFDVTRNPREVRRRIGYIPQLLSADSGLTGSENLMAVARLYGVPRAERKERIAHALSMLGLEDKGNELVRNYSGGMIRRLEIAQAILHRPEVLFMDEPTVGLDPVARRSVWEHVRELNVAFGATIIITTHYMEEAEDLCGETAIMHAGKIAAMGTPDALKIQAGGVQTLDEAFVNLTGSSMETGGHFRDIARVRKTARRLG